MNDVVKTSETEWPPTAEQQARIDKLTVDHLQKIDEAILANASSQWRKVSRVAGSAMMANSGTVPSIPDIFYAERIRDLVTAGKLESQGNLAAMRFREVRLPMGVIEKPVKRFVETKENRASFLKPGSQGRSSQYRIRPRYPSS
jgi:hypothetical protein